MFVDMTLSLLAQRSKCLWVLRSRASICCFLDWVKSILGDHEELGQGGYRCKWYFSLLITQGVKFSDISICHTEPELYRRDKASH